LTLAADRWPAWLALDGAPTGHLGGARAVWRWELGKLTGQVRLWAVIALCTAGPFLVAVAVTAQSSVPQDTLFGQWLHQSGLALPLVVLGFVGQWALPLLTSVVSGDMFSAEDRFGTWKTVMTRSCSRSALFTGKLLAAMTYTTIMLVLLGGASLAAGLILGSQPVVGLSGQLVPAGHAAAVIVASWATQLPPLLGFSALAVLLSVTTRSSPVGMGAPLLIGLLMQLLTLVNMPRWLRATFLTTPFASWHGLWVQPQFYGPLRQGVVTSAVWFIVCAVTAWAIFRRRSIAPS